MHGRVRGFSCVPVVSETHENVGLVGAAEDDAPEQQAERRGGRAEARRDAGAQGGAHGAHQRRHQLHAGRGAEEPRPQRVRR